MPSGLVSGRGRRHNPCCASYRLRYCPGTGPDWRGLRSLRPAPPLSMVRVLFWGGGGWVMRGPGGGGWSVLSQSEDQSRVHPVLVFVRLMSTQVRGPGPDVAEGSPRSDPQNATRTRNQDDRQAATYPAHRIRPPGPARTHARRRGTPSVPGPHPDKRGRHPTTRTHARRDKGRSAPSPRPAPTPDPHQETRDPRPATDSVPPTASHRTARTEQGPAPQPGPPVPRRGTVTDVPHRAGPAPPPAQ